MDLFHLLRLSYYAMAATSALALSIATRNPLFVIGTLFGAAVAHVTLDRRHAKPVRMEYITALAIAVLFYTLLPLREHNGWERNVPACFAHFLAAFQILLFFLPFRAPVLLFSFFCGLALVVFSGIMDPHASLLLRMALFVAVTAWALFVHALWNSRERFSRRASAQSARLSGRARPLNSQPENAISRRAVGQGLTMIGLLTVMCLIVGLFLYFSAPRLDDTVRYVIAWLRPENSQTPTKSGVGGRSESKTVGFSEEVELQDLGPIHQNQRAAVSVTFSGDPAEVSSSQKRVYLRGVVFSEMREGHWVRETNFEALENPAGNGPLVVVDPSLGGVTTRGVQVQQQIEKLDTPTNIFFATGPVLRLNVPAAEINREGVLRLPGAQFVRNYTIWSALPIHPDHLDTVVKAEHPQQSRYTETTLGQGDTNRLLLLLLDITKGRENGLQQALEIERFLREDPRFGYTLQLNEIVRARGKDPIAEFLLSEDPNQRRGHCSYFASAFVTLCRLRKIPARLAGGFATQLSDEARDARKLVFKNSDAHAWAEVYFKDIGWVIFDPTPAAPDSNAPIAAVPVSRPAAASQPASEGIWDHVLNFDGQKQREMYEKLGLALQDGIGGAGDLMIGESLFGWVGAALSWLGAGIFVIWASRAFLGRSGRRGGIAANLKGRNRAAVTFYNDLLHALSRCGYVRRPEQTPREFATHVLRVGGERFRCVMDVTDVFERVRYGGGDVSQDQFNQLQTALDHLREQAFVSTAPARES